MALRVAEALEIWHTTDILFVVTCDRHHDKTWIVATRVWKGKIFCMLLIYCRHPIWMESCWWETWAWVGEEKNIIHRISYIRETTKIRKACWKLCWHLWVFGKLIASFRWYRWFFRLENFWSICTSKNTAVWYVFNVKMLLQKSVQVSSLYRKQSRKAQGVSGVWCSFRTKMPVVKSCVVSSNVSACQLICCRLVYY